MIIRTFCAAFKDVSLWTSYYPDLMLIGRNEKAEMDFNYFRRAFEEFDVKKDFVPYGIRSPEGIFSGFWLDDGSLRKLGKGSRVNRDNFPYLEFSAPRNLYRDTLKANLLLLESARKPIFPEIVGLEPPIPQNERFYNEIARGFLAKRMYESARSALNVSKVIMPENQGYLEVSGILNYREGNFDAATEILSKAVLRNPDSAESHYYLGLALQKKGRIPDAVNELGKAVSLAPENSDYLLGMADILYEAQQYSPALKLYDQVLALKGNSFHSLTRMVDIVVKIGDIPQRLMMLNLLIARYPHLRQGYEQLGQVFEKGQLYRQASEIYEAMAKQFPSDASSWVHLARIYKKLGREADAGKSARKAARINPLLKKDAEFRSLLHG